MNDTVTPDPITLFDRPARLGTYAAAARERAFADQVWVRPAPVHPLPAVATRLHADQRIDLAAWPEPSTLREGDRLVIHVPSTTDGRERFVAWLRTVAPAAPVELSVAPCSTEAGGMHRLWCIGAARVLLPPHVHIEARHDLIGIRLAQLAVGFGADTLAGPIEPDRTLPLAGVTRPDENTSTGLATLVRQVGLIPLTDAPRNESSP